MPKTPSQKRRIRKKRVSVGYQEESRAMRRLVTILLSYYIRCFFYCTLDFICVNILMFFLLFMQVFQGQT